MIDKNQRFYKINKDGKKAKIAISRRKIKEQNTIINKDVEVKKVKKLTKVKNFFVKLIPTRRRIIQLYAALLYNANIKGFISGEIFEGLSKSTCLPGLNCYSCPGAIGACPLGSLQNALYESKTKLPTYVLGIILLYAIILGRTICGFLCPVGLLQELLYKIKTPKLKKSKFTRILSYFKYILLVVLVIILPLVYALQANKIPLPGFCKYICPAGTFEGAIFLLANPNNNSFFGMLGGLFTWKFLLLIIFIVAAIFIFRFFCRFFCPLGAIYGIFNKLSILGIKVDKSKCNHCQACITHCKMDVKEVGDHECIQCGECKKVCSCGAIDWKIIRKFVKEEVNKIDQNNEIAEIEVKSKKISNKVFTRIVGIIMTIVLVITLIFVNFQKKILEVNDVCSNLVITTIDNQDFNIKTDNKTTLVYFNNEINNSEFEQIKKYHNDNLNIILIMKEPNFINNEINELSKYNILIVKDDNKIQKDFSKDEGKLLVFIDHTDKILLKKNAFITEEEYLSIILPTTLGKTVGNKVGDICLNKEINLIGNEESFSVLKNRGKITIINFWYTSCTPCVQELPHFNKLYEEFKDEINVIAIHNAAMYERNPQEVKNFINEQFKDYTIMFGYDDVQSPYYEALGGKKAWPTTIIVDQEGIISFVKDGSLSETDLRAQIEALLA